MKDEKLLSETNCGPIDLVCEAKQALEGIEDLLRCVAGVSQDMMDVRPFNLLVLITRAKEPLVLALRRIETLQKERDALYKAAMEKPVPLYATRLVGDEEPPVKPARPGKDEPPVRPL